MQIMKDGKQRKIKVVNIGDAIQKKDLIRIRSGSPGLRAGAKKQDLCNGMTFQGEMKQHGMAGELQEIQRFNFVLMSRSTDVPEDQNALQNEQNLQMYKSQ